MLINQMRQMWRVSMNRIEKDAGSRSINSTSHHFCRDRTEMLLKKWKRSSLGISGASAPAEKKLVTMWTKHERDSSVAFKISIFIMMKQQKDESHYRISDEHK